MEAPGGGGAPHGKQSPPVVRILSLEPKALHVSLHELVFDADERGPGQPRMRLLIEAIERLDPKEQAVIRELLEGMIVKYEARRWSATG
jgi:hypothetical protein